MVAGDEDWFVEEAKKAKAAITHVIDTHVHADHLSGGRKLARMVGAPYCLHEHAAGVVKFPFEPLRDNQVIEAGNVLVRVLHTPGHTPESVSLLVIDKRRGEEPWFVLTGDTLFVGAVGRPDLLGREREMAGMLSIPCRPSSCRCPTPSKSFPRTRPAASAVQGCPGKPSSTLGFERRWNPALSIRNRDEFIAYLTRDIPPRPARYGSNRGGEPRRVTAVAA